MLLPTNLVVGNVEVLLVLVWTFLTGLLGLSRWDIRNCSHAFLYYSFVVCLSWWLLTAIFCIKHIIWYSFLFFAVLCKCNNKFIWRSRENFRANSAWNEWRFDKDASGYSTSKASVSCSFLKYAFCQFILLDLSIFFSFV